MTDADVLEQRRDEIYGRLGVLHGDVVSRIVPGPVCWPDSALGKMRLIRRTDGHLIVTSGLSNFYDADLHDNPPPAPLDFELCLDVSLDEPAAASPQALARSWLPSLLYALADVVVADWTDVRGALTRFRAITLAAVPLTDEAEKLADDRGLVGYLLGLPILGGDLDMHLYINGYYRGLRPGLDDVAVGVFPVKPLTPDEYRWAVEHGNDGGVALAEKFLRRGDGAKHWTGRPSVLVQPSL